MRYVGTCEIVRYSEYKYVHCLFPIKIWYCYVNCCIQKTTILSQYRFVLVLYYTVYTYFYGEYVYTFLDIMKYKEYIRVLSFRRDLYRHDCRLSNIS